MVRSLVLVFKKYYRASQKECLIANWDIVVPMESSWTFPCSLDTKACLSTRHVLVSDTNELKCMERHKKTKTQVLNSLSDILFETPCTSNFSIILLPQRICSTNPKLARAVSCSELQALKHIWLNCFLTFGDIMIGRQQNFKRI